MILNHHYCGYRASVLPEDDNDKACDYRTYIIFKGDKFNLVSVGNEYTDNECIAQIHNIIDKMKKEQSKMTREEAINKLNALHGPGAEYNSNRKIVDTLETLGLLKFEEEKRVSPAVLIINDFLDKMQKKYGDIPICAAGLEIEAELKKYGFQIVAKIG